MCVRRSAPGFCPALPVPVSFLFSVLAASSVSVTPRTAKQCGRCPRTYSSPRTGAVIETSSWCVTLTTLLALLGKGPAQEVELEQQEVLRDRLLRGHVGDPGQWQHLVRVRSEE